jgi:hypothetical protein
VLVTERPDVLSDGALKMYPILKIFCQILITTFSVKKVAQKLRLITLDLRTLFCRKLPKIAGNSDHNTGTIYDRIPEPRIAPSGTRSTASAARNAA